MSGLAGLAGGLGVEVTVAEWQVVRVQVRLERPLAGIARLLEGQAPEGALARIPRLFSLCAAAHQVAAVRALEQAAGWQAPRVVEQARTRLSEVELVRESLLRLVRDWALPIGLDRLRSLLDQCQRTLDAGRDCLGWQAGAVAAGAVSALAWPALALPDTADWLGERRMGWRDIRLGALPPPLEPQRVAQWLPRLTSGAAELDGLPRMTGPVVASMPHASAGEQIEQRLAALLARARLALNQLEAPRLPPTAPDLPTGEGVGLVRTARGWLLHHVRLEDGRVAGWRIVAPTDWNFHPAGVLSGQLQGIRLPERGAETLLRELILTVDPCVAFEASIVHA